MASPCTVTAQFNDSTGANLQGNAFVRFRLRNYSGFVPRVLGTAILVEPQIDVVPNGSGLVTTQLWGNDSIDPGGSNNPPSTFYTVEYWNQGRITSQGNFSIIGASFNLGTAAQINPPPTPGGSGATALLLEVNGVKASSQTVQNLVGSGVVDAGSGNIQISGGSGSTPDPTKSFFGRTNIDLIGNSLQSGDPQVLFDTANNQWVMFYYVVPASGPSVETFKAVATNLEGPWTGNTRLTTLDNYHKMRVLCDVNGNPFQVGGSYYAIAVFYSGTLASKQIFLFSNPTLQADTWTLLNSSNPIVPKAGAGGAGVYDDFNTDSPTFLFDSKTATFYIWYSGFPSVSQSDFAFSPRILLSTATVVTGPYTKQVGFVLGSSTVGGTWDFGYAEGPQVLALASGGYFMAYIGGSTRAGSAGAEPNTNLWGFATATNLTGPWTKIPGPFIQLTGLPQWPTGVPNSGSVGTIVDTTNIWRPHCVLDPTTNRWYVFYNTGNGAAPVERITFARQGMLSFSNGAYVGGIATPPGPNGGYILILTTSEQQIPGSQVFLRPGRYRVKYQVVEQDVGGTLPHLDISFFIRPNGTKAGPWSKGFIGSYAFEGDDFEVEDEIVIASPAGGSDTSQFVDASIQVTNGTPTVNTAARNLRVLVEQL